MGNWDSLSMRDKRDVMRLHIKNGIRDLDGIRESYNAYANGGNIYGGPQPGSSQMNVTKTSEQMSNAEWSAMMEAKRDAAARRIADNPDFLTSAANLMSYPVEWVKSPRRLLDDISSEIKGVQSPTARENWRENYNVARGKQSPTYRAIQSAPKYIANGLTMAAGAPKTVASVVFGDLISGDNTNITEGVNAATGAAPTRVSEFQKQSGGIADVQQSINNVNNGEYGKAAWNAITGGAGLFDSSSLPSNFPLTKIDNFLDGVNVAGDVLDSFGAGNYIYDKIKKRKKTK